MEEPSAASIYTSVPFRQDTSFLVVGERTNANGSKRFREAMLEADWDTCVAMARDQIKEGAHVIDVCVDYTGADGVADMTEIASRFATQASVPLMVDSTEGPVARAALEWIGGRPILNSVNLEEGDAPGTRLDTFLRLAREFGAAVVCTCIDEEGQARTAEWKLRAARNIRDIAVDRYGLAPEDLLFDPLALPLSTGMEESRNDGIETIEGIRSIKAELPGVSTILGLSNVSFGLNPAARQVLNSVFLHECVEAGLDSAIVHASKILPLSRIEERAKEISLDLVYNRRTDSLRPAQELLALFDGVKVNAGSEDAHLDWPVDQRLSQRIIDGNRNGLDDDLAEALDSGLSALAIVNDVLLEGMKVVGERFASGEMQLPFVLQSAETMKAAVAFLEPHMEKSDQGGKGTVVLATVKGDVHDIGKNLVDIILTNNGYEVINLGIKIGINEMIAAAEEHKADAIGMSGLLVKSTLIMRENLVELNQRDLADFPILLGGAALTRTYVERDLREIYDGRLFYGRDAFEGLRTMDRLVELKKSGEDDPLFGREISKKNVPEAQPARTTGRPRRSRANRPGPTWPPTIPSSSPPFVGTRVAKGIPLDDIAEYLNLTALFRNQWGFRPENGEDDNGVQDPGAGHPARGAGQGQGGRPPHPPGRLRALCRQRRGQRPRHLEGRGADRGVDALHVPTTAQGTLALHLRLLPLHRLGRRGLRQLHAVHHRSPGLGGGGPALRREPVPELPVPSRSQRRDGRGHGRVLASPRTGRARLRRRGRPLAGRPLPPDVSGRALLVGLSGLPGPHRQRQGRRAPRRRAHRRDGERGVPDAPRADHRRHHLPPPRGQVLRGLTTAATTARIPRQYRTDRLPVSAPLATAATLPLPPQPHRGRGSSTG